MLEKENLKPKIVGTNKDMRVTFILHLYALNYEKPSYIANNSKFIASNRTDMEIYIYALYTHLNDVVQCEKTFMSEI